MYHFFVFTLYTSLTKEGSELLATNLTFSLLSLQFIHSDHIILHPRFPGIFHPPGKMGSPNR